jgi:hypothetical protein
MDAGERGPGPGGPSRWGDPFPRWRGEDLAGRGPAGAPRGGVAASRSAPPGGAALRPGGAGRAPQPSRPDLPHVESRPRRKLRPRGRSPLPGHPSLAQPPRRGRVSGLLRKPLRGFVRFGSLRARCGMGDLHGGRAARIRVLRAALAAAGALHRPHRPAPAAAPLGPGLPPIPLELRKRGRSPRRGSGVPGPRPSAPRHPPGHRLHGRLSGVHGGPSTVPQSVGADPRAGRAGDPDGG